MADATAPTSEPAPVSATSEETVEKQPTITDAVDDPTYEATPAMSGALQSPDAGVAKAPEAPEESKVNGDAPTVTRTTEAPVGEEKPAETSDDTEMKDPTAEDAAAAPATDAQAAPTGDDSAASSKKGANGKRKSVGGVPEHKSKKLNKKKSMPKMTHLDAQPGEYYFARLKSYPPWPSIVCDEEMLPTSLLSTRPVTTKQADGSYKEAYAPGGKREHERTFPVMFLHTNEFAWIPNTDLTPLTPEECKDVSQKGKSKSLIAAYEVAAEGKELKVYKDMLMDHQRAIEEDLQLREQRAAEKAEKAAKSDAKKKRKSVDASAAEDVDMEDVGDEEGEAKPKSSKKRKKDAESEGEAEKTPKTATKLKLTTPKAPASESSKKTKDSAKPAKSKAASAKKAKAEEDDASSKEPEKPVDPAEQKAKKEREVLYLRHKLQKGFLSRDTPPKEEEMKTMSGYIQKLEEYEDLEVSIIRATKVNKVLKAIIKLNSIPKDEEFNFRKRSHDLLESWNKLLGADGGDVGGGKDDEPTTNGVHAKDEEKEAEAEKESAPKVAAPTEAANAAQDTVVPADPAEAKEAIVDKMVDGPAASGAVAAEAEKPAEEVKNDAEETAPSTEASATEGVETS